MQTWHTAYEVGLRNPRIIARSLDQDGANPRFAHTVYTYVIHTYVYIRTSIMKALKCKTLGGIQQQSCVYTAHARTSASLSRPASGLRLYLACSRRLHQ